MNPYWNLYTISPHESLLNLWASKATPSSTEFLTGICGQFSCMNPYWICAHLKLVKIRHECLLNFVHNFSAWILTEFVSNSASKASQNSTRILTEICGQFSCMNPYWICGHLKLIKIEHKSFWKLYTIFPHESLLNLWTSKPSQNWTEFLNEMCGQFCRMNPHWNCQHLSLVKIQQISAWILTEFVSIWS